MAKEIEIIPINDLQTLKQDLEKMVNDGWEIKGVINNNTYDAGSLPFVILQRSSDDFINEDVYSDLQEQTKEYNNIKSSPPQKEISISVGGD